MSVKIRIALTGDSFITQNLQGSDKNRKLLGKLLQKTDVRFVNLETTLGAGNYPGAVSGGTWASSPPSVLSDLEEYGFNLFSIANNHALDYSIGGLESTIQYLEKRGLAYAGAGVNMLHASLPAFFTCKDFTVAMVSTTSTFHESWIAGEVRYDSLGRPGINPLRFKTTFQVDQNTMDHIRAIAEQTEINAAREISISEGFTVREEDESDQDVYVFGKHRFRVGDPQGETTSLVENDLKRILASITKAKKKADIVLVSVHSHEMIHGNKELPAKFLIEFSHRCIEEGAHAVVGHGPHILRGMEIYKGQPIFYSLGNFIFQNESISVLPSDFYEKYNLDNSATVEEALAARSQHGKRGLGREPRVWESLVPIMTFLNGSVREILLYPIRIGTERMGNAQGWPKLAEDTEIIERFSRLSEAFGTEIRISKNRKIGFVEIPEYHEEGPYRRKELLS